MRKRRKLKKGEKRIQLGFTKKQTRIIKPKDLNKWKIDKKYDRKLKIWIPNRQFQFEKGRYRKKKKITKIETTAIKETKDTKITFKREVKFRRRKQAVINFVNKDARDTGLIYLSIRAITINPNITFRGLLILARENQINLEQATGVNLREYKSYIGDEDEPISIGEDTRLNDFKVHIELFYDGRVIQTYSI